VWYETDSFIYDIFQGPLLKVTSVSDSIVNNDENIRFIVTVDAEVAGDYTLSGFLFKDEGDTFTDLEYVKKELELTAGVHQVQLDFDAKKIKGKGISGTYNLSLRAEDHLYASGYDYISASYLLSQLASPALYLVGPMYDINTLGSRSGSNQLSVFLPLDVTVADTYTVYASIWDEDFNLISVTNSQPYLSVGTPDYEITFDTFSVAESELEGVFTVSVGILDQNGSSMVFENYRIEVNTTY
jgi:hypothetical protein